MGAFIALIVVGFLMATLGVALLFLGEVPFIAGRRIPAWRARLIGVILLCYLPVALGLVKGTNFLFPDTVDGQVVTWSLCGFCWFVVSVILFRVVVPKRAPRPAAKGDATPSKQKGAESPESRSAKKTPAKPKTPEPAPESLAWLEAEPEPEPAQKTPAKKPAGKKAPKAPVEDENPFDFS